jgi:isochorismate hydrolase
VTVPSGLFEVKGHANYRLIVVADCCADPDPEVHRVLLEKVFARPATVTTAEAIIGALA